MNDFETYTLMAHLRFPEFQKSSEKYREMVAWRNAELARYRESPAAWAAERSRLRLYWLVAQSPKPKSTFSHQLKNHNNESFRDQSRKCAERA